MYLFESLTPSVMLPECIACCLIIIFYSDKVMPTPLEAGDDHDFLVVSLNGKTVQQVMLIPIHVGKLDGSSNIEIHGVVRCPTEWPESDLCVKVNISVTVNDSESHELSAKSLRNMWRTHSPEQLRQLGMEEYNIPSSSTILVLWVCVTAILFLLFFIILICAIKTKFVERYIRSKKDILGSSNRSWLPKHGEQQLVPPFFYPEPPKIIVEEVNMGYGVEASLRKRSMGIDNPAYTHDMGRNQGFTSQISQATTAVDDFDSEDETIYPPAPLPRPVLIRNDKRNNTFMKSEPENETEL